MTLQESSGPRLGGQPNHEGFGGFLTRQIVIGQFRGQVSHEWNPEGLTVHLSLARVFPHPVFCQLVDCGLLRSWWLVKAGFTCLKMHLPKGAITRNNANRCGFPVKLSGSG